MAFTYTWNAAFEADPANSDDVSDGASEIRKLKNTLRERLEMEHYWDEGGTDADHGEHLKTTFHAPLAADPDPGADKAALYSKDVDSKAELHWEDEDDNVLQITSKGTISMPAGIMMPYGGATAPTGWLLCDGSDVSRTTYATLFGIIGETFGVGNGSTTFGLPDMRGRFPLGKDNMGGNSADIVTDAEADSIGGTGGNELKDLEHEHATAGHTLTIAEMPAHTHTEVGWNPNAGGYTGSGSGNKQNTNTGSAGGGGSHDHGDTTGCELTATEDVMNPFQTFNYIIKI